jgi:hypothetical protein
MADLATFAMDAHGDLSGSWIDAPPFNPTGSRSKRITATITISEIAFS